MTAGKNIVYYFLATVIFFLLKFAFTFTTVNDLIFLLNPTDGLVELVTGSQSVYLSGSGYYHEKFNILIDKSCLGFNFWLLCFLMLTFLTLQYFNRHLHKALIIPASLFFAYLATLFVNASRIAASILAQKMANNFLPERPHFILHESVGVITNLIFLIAIYYLTERLLINKLPHAKPAKP